jgi:phosphate uptake regulator
MERLVIDSTEDLRKESTEDLDEAIDYSRKIANVKSQMSRSSRQKENPQRYVEKEMMELEDALNNFHYSVIGTLMNKVDSRMKIDLRHIEKKIEEIIELTSNWTV